MAKKQDRPLTIKQEQFCEEYVSIGNATEAYRIVYGQGNYSDESLNEVACRLKNNIKVLSRIEEIRAERKARSTLELEESNRILTNIARANPKDLFYRDPKTGKPKVRAPYQLAGETSDAIRIMTNHGGHLNYQFHSKIEALKQLARQNGWDSIQVNTNMPLVNGGIRILGLDGENGKMQETSSGNL